jgi:hypothetical protein
LTIANTIVPVISRFRFKSYDAKSSSPVRIQRGREAAVRAHRKSKCVRAGRDGRNAELIDECSHAVIPAIQPQILSRFVAVEVRWDLGQRIDQEVGGICAEAVNAEAIGDAAGPNSRIAGGANIDVGIAHHHGFLRRGIEITKEDANADRIGFLFFEAVPAVDITEIAGKIEALEDGAAEDDRLVGQDSHGMLGEKSKTFADTGIRDSVVEHVRAIVGQEVGKAFVCVNIRNFSRRCTFAEGAANENGRAIADKTVNGFVGERGASHVFEHRVDGKSEVELRIDESAIEIEDEDADTGEELLARHSARIRSVEGTFYAERTGMSLMRTSKRQSVSIGFAARLTECEGEGGRRAKVES